MKEKDKLLENTPNQVLKDIQQSNRWLDNYTIKIPLILNILKNDK